MKFKAKVVETKTVEIEMDSRVGDAIYAEGTSIYAVMDVLLKYKLGSSVEGQREVLYSENAGYVRGAVNYLTEAHTLAQDILKKTAGV